MNLRRLDKGEDTIRQAKCTLTVSGDVLGFMLLLGYRLLLFPSCMEGTM